METIATDDQIKILNFSRSWLNQILPFLLSKSHRVSYGLLTQSNGAHIPISRRLLAVPFIGKDCPSDTNEFSDPDVVIGFTILAYRYNGLRSKDFSFMIKKLQLKLKSETGMLDRRPTSKLFRSWVSLSGGLMRGQRMKKHSGQVEVQPIYLINDADELFDAYKVLRKTPHGIEYVLKDVFPETMRQSTMKISASGQAIGGRRRGKKKKK